MDSSDWLNAQISNVILGTHPKGGHSASNNNNNNNNEQSVEGEAFSALKGKKNSKERK